jgi:O-6-methylguanine DNA methyltransferase
MPMKGSSIAAELVVRTTWGNIRVTARDGKVIRCAMPQVRRLPQRAFRIIASRIKASAAPDRAALNRADAFIRGLFNGGRAQLPPLEVPQGGAFLKKAWEAMLGLRPGQVISYAELARRAGSPRAVRAAGQACARNDIPLFIPCHRVLGSSGNLGGFSCGIAWKKLLLARELPNAELTAV